MLELSSTLPLRRVGSIKHLQDSWCSGAEKGPGNTFHAMGRSILSYTG